MSPYQDGRSAAAYDIRRSCCPHKEGSQDHADWMRGYEDQLAQELIERPVLE